MTAIQRIIIFLLAGALGLALVLPAFADTQPAVVGPTPAATWASGSGTASPVPGGIIGSGTASPVPGGIIGSGTASPVPGGLGCGRP